MAPWLRHLLDVLVGTLLVRVAFGCLTVSRRLLRRLIPLVVMVALAAALLWADLPFSRAVGLVLLVPVSLGLLWSALPDFGKIYRTLAHGRPFSLRPGRDVGDEAMAALLALAEHHRGALLIFVRGDDVTPLLSGGEEISAEVNKSLLLSIFYPGCPRHDGAVVIEGGRIVRIGAVLPLASAEETPPHLGTRHLAAIGLSERCDADIFIVSEERGAISHVRGGRLVEVSAEARRSPERLAAELAIATDRRGRLSRRSASALLWGGSAAVATLGTLYIDTWKAWLFPSTQETSIVEATIGVVNLPGGLFVSDLSATTCKLYVSARTGGLSLNLQDPLKVLIDPRGLSLGEVEISLMASMVQNLRPGWRVERFEPPEIRFILAKARTEELPVRAVFTGLDPELGAKNVRVGPSTVRAQIRDPDWHGSDPVETLPVDLSKIRRPGRYEVQAQLNFPASIEPLGQRSVTVTLEIARRQDQQEE